MYLPAEQHPYRPVNPEYEKDARGQHNVCVKPLLPNALKKEKSIHGTLMKTEISADTQKKKTESVYGRVFYVLDPNQFVTAPTFQAERSPLKALAP